MKKLRFAPLALVFCALIVAWPAIGSSDATARTDSSAVSQLVEAGEAGLCLDAVESQVGAAKVQFVPPGLLFSPAPSWNCNGCVEPSACSYHFECGFPQGYCIAGFCRCICDPDV